MIIGLSHITINSINIEKQRKHYLDKGWSEIFFSPGIYNHPAKKLLLNSYNELHDICMFNKAGCNDVELVKHGDKKHFENNVYAISDDGIIILQCRHYEMSLVFWRDCMGFVEEGELLIKASPMPQWNCKIKLIESNVEPISKLDNVGISCLAFYTTDLAGDIVEIQKKFNKEKLTVSDDIRLNVNGKNLRINMLQAASSEIIELIEFGN
jgi:hypothetical protein